MCDKSRGKGCLKCYSYQGKGWGQEGAIFVVHNKVQTLTALKNKFIHAKVLKQSSDLLNFLLFVFRKDISYFDFKVFVKLGRSSIKKKMKVWISSKGGGGVRPQI